MAAPIEIKNLSFSYVPGKPVLKNVALEVRKGEKMGIIGPTGAGKSTLLLHLNGILFGNGMVKIGDVLVEKENLSDIRRMVGLIFQNPDDQLFNPTVGEDIAFGPLNFGFSPDEVTNRIDEAISAMHLQGFENLESHHLSMGERKRVALATVLAIKPDVIAFDEPFASLDPGMVEQLIHIIKGLDATVIIVSQSIIPMLACCDRLALIHEGQILADGPPKNIVNNTELMKSAGMDMDFYHKIYRDYF
jgi:cobalt/nickel transport system ATP-binding protein